MKLISIAAMAAVLTCAAPVWAQPAQPAPADEEIVVVGRQVDDAVRDFVTQLSAPPPAEDQLARWDGEVCVGAIGLQARYGQFLVDRISQRAAQLGLRPGQPGCRANVVVFVTPDSDRLTREIVAQFQDLVGARWEDNSNTQGREALQAFVDTPRTVRWWHVSQTVTADGQRLGDVQASNGAGGLRGQVVRTTSLGFGRLSRTTRQDFSRVVIVVDATRAAGLQFDSIADYVAMVALAQVDPDADTSAYPTILNLFSADANRPTTMSEWDLAYLDGLYNARRTARNSNAQEQDIARRMREGGQAAN